MNHNDPIVVTGMGLVTPLGGTVAEAWARCSAGCSGIGEMRLFDVGGYGCRAAAEIPHYQLAGLRLPKNEKFMSRGVRHLIRAAQEAVAGAGLNMAETDLGRVAVHVGSGQVGPEPSEFFRAFRAAQKSDGSPDWERLGGPVSRLVDPYFPLRTLSNAGVALLAMELGARGPSNNFVQGDVASAMALRAACRDLFEYRCDIAVVGGCDFLLTPAVYLTYNKAGLLSVRSPTEAGRPFDAAADGIVLGEGAAVVILERLSSARKRNREALAEIVRVGAATETDSSFEPFATPKTVRASVAEALGAERPDFVIAAGFGIPGADRREADILTSLFNGTIAITALKGKTGYLGAATALVEVVLGIQMLRHGVVPPLNGSTTTALTSGCLRGGLCLSHTWTGQSAAVYVRPVRPAGAAID